MRAMILYEHCSPHQVTAVEAARTLFDAEEHTLIPVEFYFRSHDYGWTLKDKQRSPDWVCLFPDQQKVSDHDLYRAIVEHVKKYKIDVLVINGWYGRYAWRLGFSCWLLPCKLVMVSDSVYWDFPRKAYKEFPKKLLMRCMDAGFVAGTPQADYLRSLGMPSNKLAPGNDVVDNSMYLTVPPRSSPQGRKIIIGTAARLIPKKNLQAAMRALVAVLGQYPAWDVEWHIAGRGPLDEELKQLAQQLQAPVVFSGFVGYYDMPGFYAALDLYWQPSISEPWGLVVNEAMASALPILASDRCGCTIDLVTPNVGWVHGIDESAMQQGLINALKELPTWPQRGKAAREQIEHWGCPRFAAGLLESCRMALSR